MGSCVIVKLPLVTELFLPLIIIVPTRHNDHSISQPLGHFSNQQELFTLLQPNANRLTTITLDHSYQLSEQTKCGRKTPENSYNVVCS